MEGGRRAASWGDKPAQGGRGMVAEVGAAVGAVVGAGARAAAAAAAAACSAGWRTRE